MTTDTEALRAQFEKLLSDSGRACFYAGDGQYGYPHDFSWLCYQAGHAAAKAETADVAAKEREWAATVVDEKIGSVRKANPGRGGRINSAVAFALDALGDCAGAIRAGAKEPSDAA